MFCNEIRRENNDVILITLEIYFLENFELGILKTNETFKNCYKKCFKKEEEYYGLKHFVIVEYEYL